MSTSPQIPLDQRLRAAGLPLVLRPSARARAVLPGSAGLVTFLGVFLLAGTALNRANAAAESLIPALDAGDFSAITPSHPMVVWMLVAAALVLVAPLAGWLVSVLVRRAHGAARQAVGLAAGLFLAIAPAAAFGIAAGESPLVTVGVLAAVWVASYFGVGTIIRWSGRRVVRELGTLGPMVARVLPLLMVAFLFFFYNAEIWQVMAALNWGRVWAVVGILALLTTALVAMTTRDDLQTVLGAHATPVDADRPTPLRRAERLNLLLIPCLVTGIQATLFATLVFGFLLFFGWLSVPDATVAAWTGRPAESFGGIGAAVPLTTTLVKVSLALAGFSALNFAASTSADRYHRTRFVEPLLDEVVHTLELRDAYVLATARPDAPSARP